MEMATAWADGGRRRKDRGRGLRIGRSGAWLWLSGSWLTLVGVWMVRDGGVHGEAARASGCRCLAAGLGVAGCLGIRACPVDGHLYVDAWRLVDLGVGKHLHVDALPVSEEACIYL